MSKSKKMNQNEINAEGIDINANINETNLSANIGSISKSNVEQPKKRGRKPKSVNSKTSNNSVETEFEQKNDSDLQTESIAKSKIVEIPNNIPNLINNHLPDISVINKDKQKPVLKSKIMNFPVKKTVKINGIPVGEDQNLSVSISELDKIDKQVTGDSADRIVNKNKFKKNKKSKHNKNSKNEELKPLNPNYESSEFSENTDIVPTEDAIENNQIVRGKNYYKNKKRKENNRRKLELLKKSNVANSIDTDLLEVKLLDDPDSLVSLDSTDKLAGEISVSEKTDKLAKIDSNKMQKNNKNKHKAPKKDRKVTETSDTDILILEPANPQKGKPQLTNKGTIAKEKTLPPKMKKSEPVRDLLYSHLSVSKQLTKTQANNEFLNKFLIDVENYLKQQAYIEPGGKILVAVSGGVDSIVMMDCMAILAEKMRFSLYIAHFNHKLRGLSSDADEVLVRSTSKEYNLHFYSGSGNVKQYSSKNSISIEHAARILRYNFFERTARNIGVDIVATAHTEDDLVETFFINLFRGSGLTGLSSMPSKRKFVKNVSLVRPFLQFNKSELYEYAKIRKLKWNEDETNSLLNYTRNKIRHDLLPKLVNEYNPSIINTITRTAELIQGADEIIKDIISKSIVNVVEESSNEKFHIKINMLLTFNKFMQGELLQYAWNKYFRLQPLSLAVIDRVLDLANKQTGSICEISSGYFVLRDRNHLIFAKRSKDIATSVIIEKPGIYKIGKFKLEITDVKWSEVKFTDDKNVEYISAELLEPFAEIRNKKDGDVFFPLGSPGEMKLSDFLTNEKVSLIEKTNLMILTNRIDILWVIGYRISEKAKVDKNTKRILRLKLINTEK